MCTFIESNSCVTTTAFLPSNETHVRFGLSSGISNDCMLVDIFNAQAVGEDDGAKLNDGAGELDGNESSVDKESPLSSLSDRLFKEIATPAAMAKTPAVKRIRENTTRLRFHQGGTGVAIKTSSYGTKKASGMCGRDSL
mmetsp:Transcript_12788/g.27757  ORF Transcript_12788/g.27757 Transcript_12788/m.27757 type:complete len:139 (-) Transcript_12788:585-1001(-)